jgi:hypothetical protein
LGLGVLVGMPVGTCVVTISVDVGGTDVGGTLVGGMLVGGTAVGGIAVGGIDVGGTSVGGMDVGGILVGGTEVGGTFVGLTLVGSGGLGVAVGEHARTVVPIVANSTITILITKINFFILSSFT